MNLEKRQNMNPEEQNQPEQIIITGPTASGKSTLSVELALRINGEIISVDSRQCFKKIDIGTAKPTHEQMAAVPHHNVSILPLNEEDTVAEFRKRSKRMAADIERRAKRVIYCGGSTLHIQSIIRPLDPIPPASEENVARLKQEAEEQGMEKLYERLQDVDPDYAKKMDGLNSQRIIRALDVWEQTGKPFSSFHSEDPITLPTRFKLFALNHPRPVLHERISNRTEKMLKEGLVQEVRQLLNEGYDSDLQAFNTVGYRQVIKYLNGELSEDQMIKDIKTATRRYAKRQITWLRRWPFVEWIDLGKISRGEAVERILDQVAAEA
jgi:tRNA dimethylallyltransferase